MNAYRTEGFGTPGLKQRSPLTTGTADDTRPVAVVIGSGFGGLAAAVRE